MENINIMQQAYVKALAKEITKQGTPCADTLEAVFENMEVLAKEIDHYGTKKKFLPLNVKKLFAFLIAPRNRIEYDTTLGDSDVRVEAKFYWTPEDIHPAGVGLVKLSSNQIAPDQFLSEAERKNLMESTARGMAATRALYDAGIGLQFSGDIDDDNSDPSTPPDSNPENITIPEPNPSPEKKRRTPKEEKKKEAAHIETSVTDSTSKEPADTSSSAPEETLSEPVTIDTINTSPDTVLADVGCYTGLSLSEIYQIKPRNIVWLYRNSESEAVKCAAKSIIMADDELKQYA